MKAAIYLIVAFLISANNIFGQIDINKYLADVNADSLRAHVQWLEDMPSRFAFSGTQRDVAVSIQRKFVEIGYPNAKLDSFFVTKTWRGSVYNTWQYNVVAALNGQVSTDSVLIIGAHYDSILSGDDPLTIKAPGANDNASGVAGVIELSRIIKKNQIVPVASIEFIAFACEELGLDGSKDYSDKAVASNKKIKKMINLDMIAYETDENQENWKVNLISYTNSGTLFTEAQELTERYTILGHINNNTYQNYSDSYRFSQNGYPALFLMGSATDVNYHTVNDITANCNFEYSREIVKLSGAMLLSQNVQTVVSEVSDQFIHIYPNPANEFLYIHGTDESFTVAIFNLSGKLVMTKSIYTNQVDISDLPAGLYVIKIVFKKESVVRKFIKKSLLSGKTI
jgi:hypothetical protein